MLDLLKKTYLLGLGLATITRDKLEEVVDELIKRGELAEKDRHHVVDELMERARVEQKRLSDSVRQAAQKVVTEMGIPSRSEFEQLLERLDQLEKSLKASAKPKPKPGK